MPSVLFPRAACRACPDRQARTGDTDDNDRHLTLLPEPLQQIQTRNRADQHTEPWKARYTHAAGALMQDASTRIGAALRGDG
jgi:DDE family transposase